MPRVLPHHLSCEIYTEIIDTPEIFSKFKELGNIKLEEMHTTFNMGVGFAIVISESDSDKVLDLVTKKGYQAQKIGKLIKGNNKVVLAWKN